MLLYEKDFEKRVVENVRRWTDDISDCDTADISIQWQGQAPIVRFAFGHPVLNGRPTLGIALVAESKKNPLAPGRLLEGNELKAHVRGSIERYLHANGIQIARKSMIQDAYI